MAFTYTITETEKENLPNGDYIGILRSVEEKVYSYNGQMNFYVSVGWEILDPIEYQGRMEYEEFYTGHSDKKKSDKGKWRFSTLCKQIAQRRTGETIAEEHLVGKKAILTIENNTLENGKTYQNIINRVLLPSQSNKEASENVSMLDPVGIAGSGMVAMQASNPPIPLNDEVPF